MSRLPRRLEGDVLPSRYVKVQLQLGGRQPVEQAATEATTTKPTEAAWQIVQAWV